VQGGEVSGCSNGGLLLEARRGGDVRRWDGLTTAMWWRFGREGTASWITHGWTVRSSSYL